MKTRGKIRLVSLVGWLLILTSSAAVPTFAVCPPSSSGSAVDTCEPSPVAEHQVSWGQFIPSVLHDEKRIWTFPVRLVGHGSHFVPVAAVVLTTAGLIALDPHDTPYFRRTHTFDQFNSVFNGTNTNILMAAIPISIYGVGLARHDSYMQQTVQLAAEAVLDAEIPSVITKDISRRLAPREIPPNGNFYDTWFQQNKGLFRPKTGGFPSGHVLAAFSMATVFAERYHHRRWVPWAAYGLASFIAFSRITAKDHFPSDVFFGAALGTTIAHYVVMRPPMR
jgi:hypothetical protein